MFALSGKEKTSPQSSDMTLNAWLIFSLHFCENILSSRNTLPKPDPLSPPPSPLVGQVVKASASRAADLGSIPAFACGSFFRPSHTSDLKIGTPVATLPGAWCYRVRARTGWPGVGILRLGEVDSLICNFCLSARV